MPDQIDLTPEDEEALDAAWGNLSESDGDDGVERDGLTADLLAHLFGEDAPAALAAGGEGQKSLRVPPSPFTRGKSLFAARGTGPLSFDGKAIPEPPQAGESYFANCERDEQGHCKPSGQAGGDKGPEGRSEPGAASEPDKAPESPWQAWAGRQDARDARRRAVQTSRELIDDADKDLEGGIEERPYDLVAEAEVGELDAGSVKEAVAAANGALSAWGERAAAALKEAGVPEEEQKKFNRERQKFADYVDRAAAAYQEKVEKLAAAHAAVKELTESEPTEPEYEEPDYPNEPPEPPQPEKADYPEEPDADDYPDDASYDQAKSAWDKVTDAIDADYDKAYAAWEKDVDAWQEEHDAWDEKTEKMKEESEAAHEKAVDKWDRNHDRWEAKFDRANEKLDAAQEKHDTAYDKWKEEWTDAKEYLEDWARTTLDEEDSALDDEEAEDEEPDADEEGEGQKFLSYSVKELSERKDKLGRRYCTDDGRRVPCHGHAPGQRPEPPRAEDAAEGPGLAPASVVKEVRRLAKEKIRNVPVPTPDQIAKAREELRLAREGQGRAGGEARGGSAADRRRQRVNLFKQFGGEARGYVACHGCGRKLHHEPPPGSGMERLERGKIFVKCQGGGYQLPNLLPECFSCNRSRNDKPLREDIAC